MATPKNKLQNIIEKIVLDEMMAIGMGGISTGQIAGGPALPIGSSIRIPKDIQRPAGKKRRKLKEANSVTNFQLSNYGLSDVEELGVVDTDSDLDTETDTDKKTPKINKQKKTKKQNPFQVLMWAGDKPVPNLLKVKYSIVESTLQNHNRKLKNDAIVHCDKNLNPIIKEAVADFLNFVQSKLQIQEFPEIYLLTERQPGMTTGAYLPSERIVFALIKNRLMLDVFRTLAHELTHCKQHERKELDNLPLRKDEYDMSDINAPYENEAYANAGNFVKEWSRLWKKIDRDKLYEMQM